MDKKIFDILPPHHSGKNEIHPAIMDNKFKINSRYILLGGIIILFLAALLYQILGAKFILYLEPATRIVSSETEFKVWGEVQEINFEEGILPGYIISREQEETRTFSATGEKIEEKLAQGVIRVYNNINPPQGINLRATTRFLASSGEYFRAPDSIYLPPAKIENGRLTSSWVDVPVEAMDSGPNSNINPTKFSVPGLLGTDMYDKIYGESFEAMSGGEMSRLPEITQSDLREAEEDLKLALINGLIDEIKSENTDTIVLSDAVAVETIASESSYRVGDTNESFDYTLKTKGEALSFLNSDLEQFLAKVVQNKFGENARIVPDSLYLDYRILSFNAENKLLHVNLKFSAEIYEELFQNEWNNELSGLNRTQLKDRLLEDDRLAAFQYRITPFWLRKIPQPDRINIELQFQEK